MLAVASEDGHCEELMLVRPAFEGFDVEYATTDPELAVRDGIACIHALPDSNRHRPLRAINSARACWALVRARRPDVVVTTGALPGLLCLMAARSIGARSIWIDSLANSERLSMSGQWARRFATLWLTQWPHLATPEGPYYWGAVL